MSRQVDYALQLILALSKLDKDQYLSLRKFSAESTISFLFLQKIVVELKAAGIVNAVMGSRGGYFLAKPVAGITLSEVMSAVDKEVGVSTCTRNGECCSKSKTCTIKNGITKLNTKINNLLANVYVTDLYAA